MTELRTAPAARRDLRDIAAYSKAAFGTPRALAYLDGLSEAFDRLAERPRIGVAERDLGVGLRSFAYRSHRIYYREDGDDLLIVRILHQARNASSAFGRG